MPFLVAKGYGRLSYGEGAPLIEEQRNSVESAFHRYKDTSPEWANTEWGGWLHDRDDRGKVSKFRLRPWGRVLFDTAQPGDVILVSHLQRLFTRAYDMAETVAAARVKGFNFIALDLPIVLGPSLDNEASFILNAIAHLEGASYRAKKTPKGRDRSKRSLPHGLPPPGWLHKRFWVDGKIQAYYSRDVALRKWFTDLLELQKSMGIPDKLFIEWCEHNQVSDPHGNPVTLHRFKSCRKAMQAGWPMHNGRFDPVKPPPGAEPIGIVE